MLLKIKNLHSGYGKFNVLQGFDCEVGEGEIVVLIGPNGAGKTTVLKSIFGITEIHTGVPRPECPSDARTFWGILVWRRETMPALLRNAKQGRHGLWNALIKMLFIYKN